MILVSPQSLSNMNTWVRMAWRLRNLRMRMIGQEEQWRCTIINLDNRDAASMWVYCGHTWECVRWLIHVSGLGPRYARPRPRSIRCYQQVWLQSPIFKDRRDKRDTKYDGDSIDRNDDGNSINNQYRWDRMDDMSQSDKKDHSESTALQHQCHSNFTERSGPQRQYHNDLTAILQRSHSSAARIPSGIPKEFHKNPAEMTQQSAIP